MLHTVMNDNTTLKHYFFFSFYSAYSNQSSWYLLLTFFTLLLSVTFTLLVGSSLAYMTFQSQIPNGNKVPHPCKANFMWPGVGHRNRLGGGVRNVFGQDFQNAGYWVGLFTHTHTHIYIHIYIYIYIYI